MRMRYALVGLALTLAVSGCASSSGGGSGSGGGGVNGAKVYLLGLTRSCETCAHFADLAQATLAKQGADVTTEYVDFGAAAEQTQQFNQALSTKPAAIVIWPTDTTSIIPALERAKQQTPSTKIVVAIYKPETKGDEPYSAYVGIDEETLGAHQAQAMVDGLKQMGKPAKGSVLVIEGAPGAATTTLRLKGFNETLTKVAPELKIVASQTANWDETQAATVAGQLFAKYSSENIVGVFAESDVMLNGAILAGKRAGFTAGKDFVAVGVDCDPPGYTNISTGIQYATGLWDPYLLGSTTGAVTADLLSGKSVDKTTFVAAPQILAGNLTECNQAIGK